MSTVVSEKLRQDSTERSLGRLVADATRDLSGLVRDELDLAKSELRDDVKAGVRGSAMFGVAAFLGLLAVVLLSIAAAFGLTALGLHPAWAFLIVAGVFLVVAAVLVLVGIRQVKKVKAPERTIQTTKDSVAVLKGGTSAL
jgi:hypothetical protein